MCLPGISSVYSDEGIKDKGWISHYHSQEINHTSGIHRNTQTHTVCVFYDLMCWLSVLNEPCTSLNGINPFFVCLSILLHVLYAHSHVHISLYACIINIIVFVFVIEHLTNFLSSRRYFKVLCVLWRRHWTVSCRGSSRGT